MRGKLSKLSPILEDFIRKIAENQVIYANLFPPSIFDGRHPFLNIIDGISLWIFAKSKN